MDTKDILSQLPYSEPFLFVDEISEINSESITGNFIFSSELDFYKGHFKNNPITPGVILTECMAQIGVVCLGIYLLNEAEVTSNIPSIAMSSSNVEYLKPVYPGQKVSVHATKKYFRFNKLKCEVAMKDSEGTVVCKGEIAGMILRNE